MHSDQATDPASIKDFQIFHAIGHANGHSVASRKSHPHTEQPAKPHRAVPEFPVVVHKLVTAVDRGLRGIDPCRSQE